MEKYYINNIRFLNNIHYLFFEMHYDLLNIKDIKKINNTLNINNFFLVDKCFN